MSNIDYEELIRSPLDDLDTGSGGRWGLVVAGGAAGLLVGLLLIWMLGGEESSVATTGTTAVSPIVTELIASEYPAGYQELAPGLGARIVELIALDDVILMTVNTVVKRGEDPLAPIWPLGGTWWLESASGAVAQSTRVVLGRFDPGLFSVEFPTAPFNGENAFVTASVAERWDQQQTIGTTTLPFTGEPYAAADPVVIVVDQETTVILPQLELGRYLGRFAWKLQGPESGRVNITATLLDAAGNEIGSYESYPDLIDPSGSGFKEILWEGPFRVDQQGAETIRLDYDVSIVAVSPVSISFDIDEVPIGR